MKIKLLTLFLLTFALFSAVKNSFSQSQLYAVMPGDTVLLSVTGGNGTIQWQESTDSIIWVDISGATTVNYSIITTASGTGKRFFRAAVTDNICPNATPYYSSIVRNKIITNTSQVSVGDWFHGGIVFYTDGSGTGLVAPKQDQSTSIIWGDQIPLSGANSITNGFANTNDILAGITTRPIAASICSDLNIDSYSDWFLPAKDQLNYLYQQNVIVGGFSSSQYYWSSTQHDQLSVWSQNLVSGTIYQDAQKLFTQNLRCVRSYSITDNLAKTNTSAIVTGQPITVSVSTQPNSQIKCLGSNVTFTVSATGTAPITYQWKKDGVSIPGAINSSYTKSNLTLANEGIYTCYITNLCRTTSSNNAQLNVIDITSNAGIDARICNGQNTQLQGVGNSNHAIESGTLSYSWSPSTGLNFTNVSNPFANPIANTTYTLTVTDQRGCTETDQINVEVGNVFQNEEICLVTVDTITWKNKIMWEKTTGVGTSNYIIYKENGVNTYSQIGNTVYGQNASYVDLFSLPESHGDKYKITLLDTCGNESDKSFYHKTMNLTMSAFGSTMGLIWDDYVDESGVYVPFRYYIYRGTSPTNMSLLDSVSGSFNSYNDLNVFTVYYYIIGVKKSGGCNTSKSDFISFSNKKDNTPFIGINEVQYGTIKVSPNPFSESTIITIPNVQITNNNVSFIIYDVTGKIVRIEPLTPDRHPEIFSGSTHAQIVIERGDLKSGIYFVELRNDKVYRGKLVIE